MSDPSTPDCRTILTNISAYLDGELDATACDEIERHCQACASCSELVEGLRQTIGLCRRAGETPLPDAIRQRARDRVRLLLGPSHPGAIR
jgi:anti-sigma factor (TIGR02949 family)